MRRRLLLAVATPHLSGWWEGIISGLHGRGYDLGLVSLSPRGPVHDFCESLAIPAFALGMRRRSRFAGSLRPLRRVLQELRPEIVHAHETLPALSTVMARSGTSRPNVLYHRHHGPNSLRHAPFAMLAGLLADATLAVSASAGDYARAEPGHKNVIDVLNGIRRLEPPAIEAVQAARRIIGAEPDDLLIASVGRLRREKGQEHLIRAMSRLRNSLRVEVRLAVVGGGPEEARLKRIAEAQDASIHFLGYRRDVATWYSAADVVVLPSCEDACPLAALEAMSLGRPVVASNVGGIPELVQDGVTGLLVPPGNPTSLAAAIETLLSDPDRRQRMGEAGRAAFERRLTLDHMLDRWEAAYAQMDGAPSRSRPFGQLPER